MSDVPDFAETLLMMFLDRDAASGKVGKGMTVRRKRLVHMWNCGGTIQRLEECLQRILLQ